MKSIYLKELRSYFINITGYIFIAFILLFAGIYTLAVNLNGLYSNFTYVLGNMTIIFMIIIPVLTMRVLSEERKQKTDQLLYSLPVSMANIVIGKYLAMVTVLAAPLAVMCFYPLILSIYGTVNFAEAYSGILAFFLLGAGLASIGLFISSLTENQAISAAVCFIAVLINYFANGLSQFISGSSAASFLAFTIIIVLLALIVNYLTKNILFAAIVGAGAEIALLCVDIFAGSKLSGLFPQIMTKISLFDRFYSFTDGVFDITGIIYFLAVIAVFAYLTIQSLEKRRWS